MMTGLFHGSTLKGLAEDIINKMEEFQKEAQEIDNLLLEKEPKSFYADRFKFWLYLKLAEFDYRIPPQKKPEALDEALEGEMHNVVNSCKNFLKINKL